MDLTKDTQLIVSLSARPSNIGTRFHNFLFRELGLASTFVYKAFKPVDIAGAMQALRSLPLRGAGVSMPFKEAVIPLIDDMDETATAIDSVNTIVNNDGRLSGYNTDFLAIQVLLRKAGACSGMSAVVKGTGGMAKACCAAVSSLGITRGHVVARNEAEGRSLAEKYGYTWSAQLPPFDDEVWGVLVNATPLGMAGGDESEMLSFPSALVQCAQIVLDVVAVPRDTPLIRLAETLPGERMVVSGEAVMTLQAVEQFVLYTGVRPDALQISAAAAHARA